MPTAWGEVADLPVPGRELAGVACLQGEYTRAARLWGADETIREAIGDTVRALCRADYEHGLTAAREALGDAAFTAAWAQGRKLSLKEAVAYALDEPTTSQKEDEDLPAEG